MMHRQTSHQRLRLLAFALLSAAGRCRATYFADWSVLARDKSPTCVSIPANMTLCRNVGYTKMRLPNLVDHDTMQEASQQASSWIPLLNVKCHDDTQLFLCSLFAPVCLERPIYPCRSLCQKVRAGCLGTMKTYGFPWPSMLDCDKFPKDNDMCITSPSEKGIKPKTDDGPQCSSKPCSQPGTYENILANYCQADFVVKMKFKQVRRRFLMGRKVMTVYKTWRGTPAELKRLRKPRMRLRSEDQCCSGWVEAQSKKQRFLVMGKKEGNRLVPTFIHPWRKSDQDIKRARRMFKQIDCSNLKETSQRVVAEAFAPSLLPGGSDGGLDARKRRRTLKSMFDFDDDGLLPNSHRWDVESRPVLGHSSGRRRHRDRPKKRRLRKLRRRSPGASSRHREGRRKRPRRKNHLKRASRLHKDWLTEETSIDHNRSWSFDVNDVLSPQGGGGNASKQEVDSYFV